MLPPLQSRIPRSGNGAAAVDVQRQRRRSGGQAAIEHALGHVVVGGVVCSWEGKAKEGPTLHECAQMTVTVLYSLLARGGLCGVGVGVLEWVLGAGQRS